LIFQQLNSVHNEWSFCLVTHSYSDQQVMTSPFPLWDHHWSLFFVVADVTKSLVSDSTSFLSVQLQFHCWEDQRDNCKGRSLETDWSCQVLHHGELLLWWMWSRAV